MAPALVAALRAGGHPVDTNLEQLAQLVTEHMGAAAVAGEEERRGAATEHQPGDEDALAVDEPRARKVRSAQAPRKRTAADVVVRAADEGDGDAPPRKVKKQANAAAVKSVKRAAGQLPNEWDDDQLVTRAPLF